MERATIDFAKLRILVVENNRLMRKILREMLRGFGADEVRETDNVPEAFSLIYHEVFDVVILDFFLGEMDGTWGPPTAPSVNS